MPRICVFALVALLLRPAPSGADEQRLPSYNADIAETSISGISSGAFMAVQFATAWSSIVVGVGAIAGGPFGCSGGSASAALSTCMGGQPSPDVATMISQADRWSASGAIDSLANIARQRVYLFNGYNDAVVTRPVSNALAAFYTHYKPASLFYQTAIGAGHSQVTLEYGGGCADNGGEFINRCGYDQAGIILQHIYGVLNPRNEGPPSGQLIAFRQDEFTRPRRPIDASLNDKGFAYVPSACDAMQRCRVHIALHGCLQSYGNIGKDFLRHAGYNPWADTNHIIVLYPQIQRVTFTRLGITNPQSCWDWWGYLDSNPTQSPTYLLKAGQQISAIKGMIDRLTSGAAGQMAPSADTPMPPTTLRAVDASDTAIDLAWMPVPGAARYEVFRATVTATAFQQIATVAGPSYGDAALKSAATYRYKVRVAGTGATADFSPIVTQQTRSKVPICQEPGTCAVR